jgi:hypothetical protein
MNRMAPRLLALLALLAVIGVTLAALRDSDGWRRERPRTPRTPAADPYSALARTLAHGDSLAPPPRDPFRFGEARAATAAPRPRVQPPPVAAPALPVLTAIVSDADPRAVIHYEGRNYTVGAGGLFADYRVLSVTADAVVLERAGQQVVLNRPAKGD